MGKTDLGKFQNDWFKPGSKLKIGVWYLVNLLFLKSSLNPFSGFKVALLRFFGAKVGKGVVIKPHVNIKYPWFLEIGDHVWIGENVWIDNLTKVEIQSNVCISQGAMLLTGNHNYKKPSFDLMVGSITLEEGVWIGAKSVVCPGVICSSHSVLAVGSVATHDLEPFTIYQGNPAKAVRKREISR
ncbi:WcaF family extracellular polysaccharide biosynthesis acetyltransferase [Algoriphagus limi]|uniref:WcaF family extracellular polysaccharide biosynthesis acetyltransferase n=1 Tax=Algoriphagus limi TaxID=2975273 RepID=A0ABT2G1P5_9BACT|nr:WcaF family extracellular polysaccharide biosynthesis acetyltransferase [Algoriphagus limi]MCS5489189.1 WcaF family extracellular polysaccharide biosynthesis acetyltransferase [Algoriphagus limi]